MEATLHDTTRLQPTEPKLTQQVETVADDLKQLGRLARNRARRGLDDARQRGEQLYDQVTESSREAVQRRPLVSVAVAAGLGAVAAGLLLLSRK